MEVVFYLLTSTRNEGLISQFLSVDVEVKTDLGRANGTAVGPKPIILRGRTGMPVDWTKVLDS